MILAKAVLFFNMSCFLELPEKSVSGHNYDFLHLQSLRYSPKFNAVESTEKYPKLQVVRLHLFHLVVYFVHRQFKICHSPNLKNQKIYRHLVSQLFIFSISPFHMQHCTSQIFLPFQITHL